MPKQESLDKKDAAELDVKRLSVAFEIKNTSISAVDDVDFYLEAGETVALVGESGCGKSLTASALMRLLPAYARYGQQSEIIWSGTDVLTLSESVMRRFRGKRLAMIFQDPMTALNPVLTIGEQLAEALGHRHAWAGAKRRHNMAALLREVEIQEPERRLKQYPHQLSGGQKQRVVIAIALAGQPDVLIADEPTTALDVTTQAQILALLKRIQHQRNMSLLLITHDLSLVQAVADRVYVMYAGQIVESARVSDFFEQPLHPYTQHLLAALPHFDKRSQRLSAISGRVPSPDDRPSGCRFHPRCTHVFSPCAEQAPVLQAVKTTQSHTRSVRCHLYPEHPSPPALVHATEGWKDKPDAGPVLFSVRDLGVHFPMKRGFLGRPAQVHKAVDGLSFDLQQGKTLALVGESGSGKSTACRVLLGLQKITCGEVMFRDQAVCDLRGRALKHFRKHVQIIFQDPYSSMNPRMTVGQILAEGMEAQNNKPAWIHKRQHELLDQVNLPKGSLERYPHQFSGGQRQRLCIARALACSPNVLICDEPTSALDVSVQAQVLNLLKDLQQELNLTYLFVTHNMAVVSYLADDVLVMRDGRMVEQGTCEQLLRAPGHAYTRQLLAGVSAVKTEQA
ncbi:MAG: ABC transporter ATP-binding protein [Legionellaceae bacterium]|nr:ABC transporter ATP-binding protein [Legionellaceae bacterium]